MDINRFHYLKFVQEDIHVQFNTKENNYTSASTTKTAPHSPIHISSQQYTNSPQSNIQRQTLIQAS